MRYLTMPILVAAIAIGACDRAAPDSPAAANNQQLATPPAAEDGPGAAPADDGDRREQWSEITIPAGTSLAVLLDTAVASDNSSVEDPVSAHLTRPITVGGVTAVPEGSRVTGVVTDATRSAKIKGRATIAMRFDSLTLEGVDQRYQMETGAISRRAAATKKNDAVKILAPAAGGAIIGGIVGGGKGAAIGAGTGAGAGTAVVMGTRGKEVRLGKGTALTLRLTQPLTVRVRT